MKFVRRAFAALIVACASHGAYAAVNTDALIRDLNQQKSVEKNMKLAFWLPPEFFVATMPGGAADTQRKQIQAMLDGVVLVLAADADLGAMGAIMPRSRADLLAAARLSIGNGTELTPIPDKELRGDLKNLCDVMKPLFKNMLGALGEAVEPIAFKVPSKEFAHSNELATSQGRLTLKLNGEAPTWRLPLGSLLPPAVDTETGDEFPGDYRFSPYSGRPLTPKK